MGLEKEKGKEINTGKSVESFFREYEGIVKNNPDYRKVLKDD